MLSKILFLIKKEYLKQFELLPCISANVLFLLVDASPAVSWTMLKADTKFFLSLSFCKSSVARAKSKNNVLKKINQ